MCCGLCFSEDIKHRISNIYHPLLYETLVYVCVCVGGGGGGGGGGTHLGYQCRLGLSRSLRYGVGMFAGFFICHS